MFALTNKGEFLQDISEEQKVMVIFLRHFGCMFCRETLCELDRNRDTIEEAGYHIVIVHMGTDLYAEQFLKVYNLDDVSRISDPDQELYEAFGVKRASWITFMHPKVLGRAIVAMMRGHIPGKIKEDPFQLPGLFIYHKGEVIKKLNNKLPSEEFCYKDFIQISPA